MTNSPAALREALVSMLVEQGVLQTASVKSAMRTVPRHRFAPWLSLAEAYSDRAWILPETTPDAVSTISQPTAVALMLEGFDLAMGQRVLEIGAGTGYNAALMAHIVGERGQIVAVEIEAHLAESARARLTDYPSIQVVHGDGGQGFPAGAPYDRIVATVGAWDIPPVWQEQLKADGQLVIPLHLGGEAQDHFLIVFRREGPALSGHVITPIQMVLMRGEHAEHDRTSSSQNGRE